MNGNAQKTCVVFGNIDKFTAELCIKMAESLYNVAFCGNSGSTIVDYVKQKITEAGSKSLSYEIDFDSYQDIQKMADDIQKQWGEVSLLINCPDSILLGDFETFTGDMIKKLIDINLTSIYYSTKVFLPSMVMKRQGKIINLSSTLALKSYGLRSAVYTAAKAAVIGLTKSLNKEVGRYGITVNTVLIGFMKDAENVAINLAELDQIKKRIPVCRLGYIDEVVKAISAIAFASDYISGQTIPVDGGLSDYIF